MALHSSRIHQVDMTIPDSPPDLSSSKSSKSSSSFRSSIFSDTLSSENIAHFEDISLSENRDYDFNQKHGRSRPPVRPLHSMMGPRKSLVHTVDNVRTVHIAQNRPGSAGGPMAERSPNMPLRQMRPGFRNTSGTYSSRSPRNSQDSRSPSPVNHNVNKGLPRSGSSIAGLPASGSVRVSPGMSRRRTWAPGRKTVKQLEDEYHDSDEDVPEDAVIWNVPLTPLEPFTAASREPSPGRTITQSSPAMAKQSPMYKHPAQPRTAIITPRTPPRLGLPRSATAACFPVDTLPDMYSLRERHRSWQNDLSSEARQIALALEEHASITPADSKANTPAGSPPNASWPLRRANLSTVSLPPIQTSNIMIDPLPMSKEKEAALARTRPSWLPPKDKKEERKHLKEWERMMAHSAVAERRRAAKKINDMEITRQTQGDIERIWEEHVLPNWESAMRESRTRELWWRGINPQVRGEAWKRAIGNWLQLTEASYTRALERSSSLSEDLVKQITENASAVFPETGMFKEGTPMYASLVDVLKAYAAYRPSTSYQLSMTRPAALLLLNMPPSDAFTALANILNRPLPNAFLTRDRQGTDKWTNLAWSTLQYKLPKLHDHLIHKVAPETLAERANDTEPSQRNDSITSVSTLDTPPLSRVTSHSSSRPVSRGGKASVGEELVRPMLEGLFSAHLELETLSRLWDVYVFEGDKLLVRAFAGVLGMLESGLYGSREEVIAVLGRRQEALNLGEAEVVMAAVREAGKVERR